MLNYYSFGAGKTYIWLHGLLGNCLNLSSIARSIEGKHFLLDARNHGKSFHKKNMDYLSQSSDLLYFMNELNIPKANIIGHSMGGKTAMTFACNYPDRVEKICIMDVAPVNYYKDILNKYYGHIQNYLNFIKYENIKGKTRKEIENLCQEKFDDIKVTNLVCSNLIGNEKDYIWRVGIDFLIDSLEDIGGWNETNGVFNGQSLVIAGGNSIHTAKSPLLKPDKPLKTLYSKHFPNIKIDILNETGHFLHAENPLGVKSSLNNFFF